MSVVIADDPLRLEDSAPGVGQGQHQGHGRGCLILLSLQKSCGGCGERTGGSLHQLDRVTHPRRDAHSPITSSPHFCNQSANCLSADGWSGSSLTFSATEAGIAANQDQCGARPSSRPDVGGIRASGSHRGRAASSRVASKGGGGVCHNRPRPAGGGGHPFRHLPAASAGYIALLCVYAVAGWMDA